MTTPIVIYGGASNQTPLSVLEMARKLDPKAWERLVKLYNPLIYGWCRKAGLKPADADDVGQEVFRAVIRKISAFRHDRPGDTFGGWLRTIVQNRIRDFLRAQKKGPIDVGTLAEVQAPSDGSSSNSQLENSEERLLYHRALLLLRTECNDTTWQAFWKVVVDGEAPREVAAQLGLTVNAVYLAKSRLLRRLREDFGELIDDPSV
jgi:RNA polymerase sigma-70 factor (ECF subfamily)